jgi:threonyl-tRNA synthetase
MIVPIGPAFYEYGREVQQRIRAAGFCCDFDTDDGTTMNKKVRNAQMAQYNFILGMISSRSLFEVDSNWFYF